MNDFWQSTKSYLYMCSLYILYPLALLVCLVLMTFVDYFYVNLIGLEIGSNEVVKDKSTLETLFYALVLAPLLETLLFQFIPIRFLSTYDYLKKNKWLVIVISASLFGMVHFYNLWYIIYSFHLGLLLASFFVLIKERGGNPFFHTALLHALINLMVFFARF